MESVKYGYCPGVYLFIHIDGRSDSVDVFKPTVDFIGVMCCMPGKCRRADVN